MDLDSWNLSLFPADLFQIWSDMAPVQLVSHSPIANIKDDEHFKDWVFIGQCPAFLRIAPEFKQPLFLHLQDIGYQIFLSDFPTAFIRGNQYVHFSTLVSSLQEIGCTAVRVQAYGMKHYLPPQELHLLPMGNMHHPLAKHNTFDLGINYSSNNIALVHPRYKTSGIRRFPMLVPISKGFGSVHMALTLDQRPFLVKAYPRVVHSIKAIAGNQVLTKPSSMFTLALGRGPVLAGHGRFSLPNFTRWPSWNFENGQQRTCAQVPVTDTNFWRRGDGQLQLQDASPILHFQWSAGQTSGQTSRQILSE